MTVSVSVWVTVLVLVLVLGGTVVVVVVVVGGVVVVVVVVVLGVVVVDGVVVSLAVGVSVTVSTGPPGTGATDSDVASSLDDVVVLVVESVVSEESPVSCVIPKMIRASKMTATAPRLTRPAGLRYHGVGGVGVAAVP